MIIYARLWKQTGQKSTYDGINGNFLSIEPHARHEKQAIKKDDKNNNEIPFDSFRSKHR